jgi:hypothetical protein
MFPLPPDEMSKALDREEARIAKAVGGDALVAAAYLRVMPLVWEADAIEGLARIDGPNPALPLIRTAQEAVIVASNDYPMTKAQQQTLHGLLRTHPDKETGRGSKQKQTA